MEPADDRFRAARTLGGALLAAHLALPAAAFAQSIVGSFGSAPSPGESLTVSFSCTGAPTCVGRFTLVERIPECSNVILESSSFTMTGLNLAQSGPIQGTITLGGANNTYNRLANGTCTMAPGATDAIVPYSGTWDAARKAASITVVGDRNHAGAFTAELPGGGAAAPIFPMTVSSSIDASTATAGATLQFRPQDVGRSGGVFVFASAPQPLVQGALAAKTVPLGVSTKAGTPCVLAQMSPSGQLVAVTAAQLQAALSGTFSAQGASVSILNGVPTPRVAGATFYVGYGANGASMVDEGIFRNAVVVPGSSACPPLPYMTSLWWNPGESGWGINLNQQGSTMFATLFTYDAARAPLWLVMPAGALQADGLTFTGDLYRTTGPAFNASPFTPIGEANISRQGTMTVSFAHANAATLTYTVNGVQVQKSIQRQVFGARAANCLPTADSRAALTNYQDLWWNPAESGWGINVTHQDNTLFATLFTYEASGRGLWLVMPSGARQADGTYQGELFRTSGPAFNSVPFTPIGGADVTNVGTMRLRFPDGNTGTLTYTYQGSNVTKAITRQVFSTPQSVCN